MVGIHSVSQVSNGSKFMFNRVARIVRDNLICGSGLSIDVKRQFIMFFYYCNV